MKTAGTFALWLAILTTGVGFALLLAYALINRMLFTPRNPQAARVPQPPRLTSVRSVPSSSTQPYLPPEWKTFYGGTYSIQYPGDWILGSGGHGIITYESPNTEETQYGWVTRGALLSIASSTVYWAYGTTIARVAERLFLDCAKKEPGPVFGIGDHTARHYTVYCPGGNPDVMVILVESKDGVYVIQYDYQPRSDSQSLTILQKMVSTFRFITN